MNELNIGGACAQLSLSLQELSRRLYALAPEFIDDRVRKDIAMQVRMFGGDMMDEGLAPASARRAYVAVWGTAAAPKEWWRSPLGQAVAYWIGYHEDHVPYMEAARILNVSRQRIYQLIKDEGRLVAVDGKHAVTAGSLAAHIRASATVG